MTSSHYCVYLHAREQGAKLCPDSHTHTRVRVPFVLLLNFLHPRDYERLIRSTRLLYKHTESKKKKKKKLKRNWRQQHEDVR